MKDNGSSEMKVIENWSDEKFRYKSRIQLHLLCIICRKILNWIRQRAAKKAEKKAAEENLYTRWEQDKDLQAYPDMGLFTEYLEMGTFRPLHVVNIVINCFSFAVKKTNLQTFM